MFSLFGAQNHAENDTSLQGGAINLTRKVEFVQWTSDSPAAVRSDGPDVRTGTIYGRRPNGTIESEAFALAGNSEVVLTKIWERLLKVVLSAADGLRNVSVYQGSGGPVRMVLGPSIIECRMTFVDSYSTALAQVKRYEKIFLKTDRAISGLSLTLTSDTDARIKVGIALTINDTESVVTRLVSPVGVTFVDDNVPIAIPNLLADESIGIWIEEGLLINDPNHRASYVLQVVGTP